MGEPVASMAGCRALRAGILAAAALIASVVPGRAADPRGCIVAPTAACIAAMIDVSTLDPAATRWEALAAALAASGRADQAQAAAAAALLGDRLGGRTIEQAVTWRRVAAEALAQPGAVVSMAPIERLGPGSPTVSDNLGELARRLLGRDRALVYGQPAWLVAAEDAVLRRSGAVPPPASLPAVLDAWAASIARLPAQWQGTRWAGLASTLLDLGETDRARDALDRAEEAFRDSRNANREVAVGELLRAWLRLGDPWSALDAAQAPTALGRDGRLHASRLVEVAEGAAALGEPSLAAAAAMEAHRAARDPREGKAWIDAALLRRLIGAQIAAGDVPGARLAAEDWLRWARAPGLWRASNIAMAAAAYDTLGEPDRARALLQEALDAEPVLRHPTSGAIVAGVDLAKAVAEGTLALGDDAAAAALLRGLDANRRRTVVETVFLDQRLACDGREGTIADQVARFVAGGGPDADPAVLTLAATGTCLARGDMTLVTDGLLAARDRLRGDAQAWISPRYHLARLAAAAGRADLVTEVLSHATAEALEQPHPSRRAEALAVAALHASILFETAARASR